MGLYITANADQNLYQYQRSSLNDDTATDGAHGPASVSDVFILVGRNSQSGVMRNGLAQMAPAFTKHWAVRVQYFNGDDKVWQIFQADKEVLSPVCSDYARIRHHFAGGYKVGQTCIGVDEVSDAARNLCNNTRTYNLVGSNCQLFVLTMIDCIKSDAMPSTKHGSLLSYFKRFYPFVEIMPLHTLVNIATDVAYLSFLWGMGFLLSSRWLESKANYIPANGSLMALGILLSFFPRLVQIFTIPGFMDGHTTIGSRVVCNRTLVVRILKAVYIVVLMVSFPTVFKAMEPNLYYLTRTSFNTTIWIHIFHSTCNFIYLSLSIHSKPITEARPPCAGNLSETGHQYRHSTDGNGDKDEAQDPFHMRSSCSGQSIDSTDLVPTLFECTPSQPTATCNSIASAQHNFTHDSRKDHTGITRNLGQCEEAAKKKQEQLHDTDNHRAGIVEVTAEAEQPQPKQTPLVVRRRPRQRQRAS